MSSSLLSNNTSGEENYHEEYEMSTINMLVAIVFGALAGFLFISLIKCCIKK